MPQVSESPLAPASPSADETPALSPSGIRLQAADLVASDRLDDADALTREGVRRYPLSEDTQVIRALVCEVRQDWSGAREALQALLRLQGARAPAATWQHWVRVLRCACDEPAARDALIQALALHPGDVALHEAGGLAAPRARRAA